MAFWDRPERPEADDGILAEVDLQAGCMGVEVIDIIENSKENIQPLRRGRDAHALAAQCALQPSQVKNHNEAQRQYGPLFDFGTGTGAFLLHEPIFLA